MLNLTPMGFRRDDGVVSAWIISLLPLAAFALTARVFKVTVAVHENAQEQYWHDQHGNDFGNRTCT
jgi:hypothetical protein